MNWGECRMDLQSCQVVCRSVRAQFSRLFLGVPESFNFTADGKSILFLSAAGGGENSLYNVCLSEGDHEWKKLYSAGGVPRQLTRSEQLLRERMRATGTGVTSYDYRPEDDSLMVVDDGAQCSVVQREGEHVLALFPEFPGALDYKLCPHHTSLVGCVYEGDVWVLSASSGRKYQLTHTAANRKEEKLTAGQPSFIVQEEFDRYTGYWWCPSTVTEGHYHILFEEVNESGVDEVHTFNPSTQAVETYRYPRPGSKNAVSVLRLLDFHFTDSGEVVCETNSLPWDMKDCLSDYEYLVRAGWMPQGDSIWVQLLDREQRHLQLAVVSLKAFAGSCDLPHPLPYLLWEKRSEHWIEVSDILEFLPPSETAPIRLITTSEVAGYQHLCLIEATPPPLAGSDGEPPFVINQASCHTRQITRGEWIVFGSHVWVDDKSELVFFEGNADTPLEKHLYAVRLNEELPCEKPVRLTALGCHHSTTVDTNCGCFVTVFSCGDSAPTVAVHSFSPSTLTTTPLCTLKSGQPLPSGYTPPTYFSLPSETGETLHGMVYPPPRLAAGRVHPTVLYVYGGPHIQLVTHEFSRLLPRLQSWVQLGFAVVIIDNRGSANRGLAFAAHVKGHMGSVEVCDQVAGLKHAANLTGYIDLTRVAITGWSYGGYMSLIGLAQFPNVFKLAIAGAPVTDWMVYDTGYTERYLGVPPQAQKAYDQSSVMQYTGKFPVEPNRLLILHGLSDENVFFSHTSLLLDRLVAQGKPYQLQIYTQERHGLRSEAASSHCDATILAFLTNHL